MKTLLALALTALPTLAQANLKTLSQITLDLDRDGKEDTVSVLESTNSRNITSRALEVRLSRNGKVLLLENILDKVVIGDQDGSCAKYTDDNLPLSYSREVTLKAVSDSSFELIEGGDDDNGCWVYEKKTLQFGRKGRELVLQKYDYIHGTLGMGDAKSHFVEVFDFMKKISFRENAGFNETQQREGKWRMASSCKVTAQQFNKRGLPACATK